MKSDAPIGFLITYTLTRVANYWMYPRPYLWWHGVMDGLIVAIIVIVYLYARRKENEG